MKRSVSLIALVVILIFPALSHAQDDVEKSLGMARAMIKATAGLSDDFAEFKADFLQKDGSENSYYNTKDIDVGTTHQYVIISPKGSGRFAAIFEGADKDDKIPKLAFTAFTGGIMALGHGDDFGISHEDNQPSGVLKYFLSVKGIKVASFTYDLNENKGTLLVAWQ